MSKYKVYISPLSIKLLQYQCTHIICQNDPVHPADPHVRIKKAVKPEPVYPADPHVRIKKAVKPEPVYPADLHVRIKKAAII